MKTIRTVREGKCYVVDGNSYFNRPGPRLAHSAEILAATVHRKAFPRPPGAVPKRHRAVAMTRRGPLARDALCVVEPADRGGRAVDADGLEPGKDKLPCSI